MKYLMLVFVFVMLLAACGGSQTADFDEEAIEEACVEEGGVYLEEHNECENVSELFCTELGGEYDECGSACRHMPEDAVCTQQCIQVCSFDGN